MHRPSRDLWQQGGNPLLYIATYITSRARDRAVDLDRRTVYRKTAQGHLQEVGIFNRAEDAESVVHDHNQLLYEKEFGILHRRLDNLIDRLDSGNMGDPVV